MNEISILNLKINGHWRVRYLYQEVEPRPIICSKITIETDSNQQNKSLTVETFFEGSGQETRLVRGYRSGVTTPAKFIIESHTDGLISKDFNLRLVCTT